MVAFAFCELCTAPGRCSHIPTGRIGKFPGSWAFSKERLVYSFSPLGFLMKKSAGQVEEDGVICKQPLLRV